MQIIRMELKRDRKALLIWSLSLIALLLASYAKYTTMYQGNEEISMLMKELPRPFAILIGVSSQVDFSTLRGFYCLLASYPLYILSIHAIFLGNTLLAEEEDGKTAEFLYSKPCSRRRILCNKLLTGVVECLLLNLCAFAGCLVTFGMQKGDALGLDILYTSFAGLLLQLLFLILGASLAASAKRRSTWKVMMMIMGTIALQKGLDLVGAAGPLLLISPFSYFKPEYYLYQVPVSIAVYILTACWAAAGLFVVFYWGQKKDIRN